MNFKRKTFLLTQIAKQQKWIEGCEANGKSYAGENGGAIRQADNDALHELEAKLKANGKSYAGENGGAMSIETYVITITTESEADKDRILSALGEEVEDGNIEEDFNVKVSTTHDVRDMS